MRRLLAGALVAITACGATTTPPTELVIRARDFAFERDVWEPAAGSTVTVEMENIGNTLHNWVVLRGGVKVGSADDVNESDVLFELNVPIGDTVSGSFAVPAEGEYQVICSIPGHLESGMEGVLDVQPAPSG